MQVGIDPPEKQLSTNEKSENKNPYQLFIWALIILFSVILIRRAWVSDDAYITFRTVDNFINGYRLTWNISERVQAYTHPLWMLILAISYFITREIYITNLILSIVISVITLYLIARYLSVSIIGTAFGFLALILSKAYIDFSTSGLENALSHLIIVIFFILFFTQNYNPRKLFFLSLVASFGICNRMDLGLIFFPPLIYAYLTDRSKKGLLAIILGQIPFILWEIFATFYYGFPLPNTAYAKLNTGVPAGEYIQQGLLYLLNSLQMDPISLTIISLGVLSAWLSKDRKLITASVGILLYLAYVIKVGGDFMSGRFLTVPLICAVILIVRYDFSALRTSILVALFGGALLLGLSVENPTLHISDYGDIGRGPVHIGTNGILDERMLYYGGTGFLNAKRFLQLPDFYWANDGQIARDEGKTVADNYAIGMYGYFAGPSVYVLDRLALADPLLARLPARRMVNWRIGHMERIVPDQYLQTLHLGRNAFTDDNMHLFYDKLSLITRGSLTNPRRLIEIWKMNTGQYDYLINRDQYQYPTMIHLQSGQLDTVLPNGIQCDSKGVFHVDDSGAEVKFNTPQHASWIQFGLDHNDRYQVEYYSNDKQLAVVNIPTAFLSEPGGISARVVNVPTQAAEAGYNRIRIFPITGDGKYCLGYLKLLDSRN